METTQTSRFEEETLIAPGEIRELVARLTEQGVDEMPAHQARTLEGLAVETGIPIARLRETLSEMRRKRPVVPPAAWVGFVALAAIAGWAVRPTPPPTVVAPPVEVEAPVVQPKVEIQPDMTGTVPLSNVTYGPDGGTTQVDPSFRPTAKLPDGLSITMTVGNVLWGSGDHRADVIEKPFSSAQQATIRKNVIELLQYVRKEAARRRLVGPNAPPGYTSSMLSAMMYFGSSSAFFDLSDPKKSNDDAIREAADQIVQGLQDSLRSQARSRRSSGP